eukprot:6243376-Prymnesium_polylepis.1
MERSGLGAALKALMDAAAPGLAVANDVSEALLRDPPPVAPAPPVPDSLRARAAPRPAGEYTPEAGDLLFGAPCARGQPGADDFELGLLVRFEFEIAHILWMPQSNASGPPRSVVRTAQWESVRRNIELGVWFFVGRASVENPAKLEDFDAAACRFFDRAAAQQLVAAAEEHLDSFRSGKRARRPSKPPAAPLVA